MEYNQFTALHYAAYRPPLHHPILRKCISGSTSFKSGLDVGCGTGQSTIALARFCKKVIGIDPNEAMLEKAIPHERITYQPSKGSKYRFKDNSFDVVTFAGSLNYAKSQSLLDEVLRVSKERASIIVYDFEVVMAPFIELLGITGSDSCYNHQENFSGLNPANLALKKHEKEAVTMTMGLSELSHLLLSDDSLANFLLEKYGADHLFASIASVLSAHVANGKFNVEVRIYYTIYRTG